MADVPSEKHGASVASTTWSAPGAAPRPSTFSPLHDRRLDRQRPPHGYTAIGNQVNVAARLGGHAGPGETLVSHRTYGAVRDFVEAEEVGPLQIKGLSHPVTTYRVLRLK